MSIFLLFFWNFLFWVEYERNSGVKFFSLFHGLSYPVLAKNNDGKRFFTFFNFFTIFFQNFLGRVEFERHLGVKFCFLFLSLSHPGLAKNNVGTRFFNFFNFFAIFFGIFCPSRVWSEFGSKIFFSLSRPISSRFG